MRLHGFSLMSMVLNEYLEDEEIVKTVSPQLVRSDLSLTISGTGHGDPSQMAADNEKQAHFHQH